ncbi:MAG TPA: metallophosphoesterase [Vicinamibacterales bacterium]|nr:metallophosphoesterase [Vicinamibacterales bacterium]
MRRILLTALALVAALAPTGRLDAQDLPCEFDNVDRIVAVGDVHGAYDRFLEILQIAGIVDRRGRWAGGKTHFVQLGDVLDRGPDSRKALDLLKKLEREASNAGGRVHALIGNHEAMRLMGDMRYVVPGEYAGFVDGNSADVKRAFIDQSPKEQREALEKELVPGMIEMIRAFGPKGEYGARLRESNAVVRINGVVFLHGGISPAVAPMPCAVINQTIRRELSVDLPKTRETPAESLAAREDGPLWYRGLALEPETFEPQVAEILTAQKARAIVIAHTVPSSGRITARFGGKIFMIDTGMQPEYVPNGRASALEIQKQVFTAIYQDRREVVGGSQKLGTR